MIHTAVSWDDVQSCYDKATDGDDIVIRGGRYGVTKPTVFNGKHVRLRPESGTVELVDDTPNSVNLLTINESPAGPVDISMIQIVQGSAVHSQPNGVLVLQAATGGKPILILNNSYLMIHGSGDFIIARVNRGVISGNTAIGKVGGSNCFNNASFVRQKPGDGTWSTPALWGNKDVNGDKALYIENNRVKNMLEGLDVDDDGRAVVRYNTITNCGTATHGADTSAVGGRFIDFYKNVLVRDTSDACGGGMPVNMNGWFSLRGGTALIHENEFSEISDGWWGKKSEVTFWIENLRRRAGAYACWAGGYPAPRQTGWGFINGGTSVAGIKQDVEPVYIWGNTGGGNYNNPGIADYHPNECGPSAPMASMFIKKDREFIFGAKPGYVAYPYPHPLAGGAPIPVPPDPEPEPEPEPEPIPPVPDPSPTKTITITITVPSDAVVEIKQ